MWHQAASWRKPALLLTAIVLAFLAALWLAGHPDLLDRPIARSLNSRTALQGLTERLAFSLADPTGEGLAMTSLVWYCWFSDARSDLRAQLLAGVCAAVLAGALAHVLHEIMPFRPRPIFDTGLTFHPSGMLGGIDALRAAGLASSSSFPSERAVMYAGIATAIIFAHPRLGLLAAACAALPELGRATLGLHYPSDILGSACLGAALVCVAQFRWGLNIGYWALAWERASTPTFYVVAFLLSYQVATAFESVRGLMRGI